MKALYKFQDRYLISYEMEEDYLLVYFETDTEIASVESEVASILKELSFQMIRYDTMRSTRGVRELLVARALYATCIEPDRDAPAADAEGDSAPWQEDRDRIFASWSSEQ